MGLKASCLARQLSSVRQFHKHLYLEGRRGDDPTMAIEGPRRGRPLPKVLSMAEVDKLLAVAREGLDAEGRSGSERLKTARLSCLIELLYASGLRVSELLSLPKSAARTREPLIAIRGKGGKERLVPISEPARAAILLYRAMLEERAPGAAASPGSFPPTAKAAISRARPSRANLKSPRRPPAFRGAHQPACVAPCFREPSPAKRRGLPGGARPARPCRYFDDADLHPCARQRAKAMVRDLHPLADE